MLVSKSNCRIGEYGSISIVNDSFFHLSKIFHEYSGFPNFNLTNTDNYQIDIYSRWGEIQFSSSNPKEIWVVRDQCPDSLVQGTYFFILKYKLKGDTINHQISNSIEILRSR